VDDEQIEGVNLGDSEQPSPFPQVDITTKFEQLLVPVEQRLRAKLDEARVETDHAVTIGTKLEAAVRRELRNLLPSGFGVGHGFVYDGYGDGTRQTDLIITNPDHPLAYPEDEAGTYVVDGVSVAGEVKAVLTTDELDDCIDKGTLHKQLRMSFNEADKFIEPTHRDYIIQTGCTPAFIVVAFKSKVAPQTLLQRLADAPLVPVPAGKEMLDGVGNDPQPPIDAVLILDRAKSKSGISKSSILWNARPANRLPARPHVNGQPYYGWFALGTEAPLMLTLAWLHTVMIMRVRRGASVFVPYLTPYPNQVAYMATKATSFEPPPDANAEDDSV